MRQELLYLSHDNASHLLMTERDEPLLDLSFVTRAIITIGGVDYDSDVLGSSKIWWTDQVDIGCGGIVSDVLMFKLGSDFTQAKGTYEGCRVVLFDVSSPNGVVFTDSLTVEVR